MGETIIIQKQKETIEKQRKPLKNKGKPKKTMKQQRKPLKNKGHNLKHRKNQ